MKKRYLKVNVAQAITEFEIAIRRQVATRIIGHYKSIFRGKGLEFESYREYTASDDANLIDWKASIRAQQLLIKQYVEERDMKIFFLIDTSNSMVFGSTEKLKNEFTLEMTAALANFILKSGDRVGFALFNDKVIKEVPPGRGQRQLHLLIRSLIDPEVYGGRYNLDEVLRFMMSHLPKDISLIIVFSDFIGPRNWTRTLKVLNQKIETIGIMVSDPRDRTLPQISGQIILQDPYSDRTILIDPSLIKNAYERYTKAQEEQIINAFKEARADLVKVATEKSFVGPIVEFFRRRARRWSR